MTQQPTVIGHRGAWQGGVSARVPPIPENSLASFARAFTLGADEVETDLALSRDGRIVLLHDPALVASGGLRTVAGMDWAEIQAARPETAPLGDALDAFPGRRFVLELKRHTDVEAILARLRDPSITRHQESLRFISFDWDALRAARRIFPHIPRAWIATSREGRFDPWIREKHIRRCRDHGIEEISGHWRLIFALTAQRAIDAGLKLGLGPVNSPAAIARCLKLGAQRLYTDRLEEVLRRVRG